MMKKTILSLVSLLLATAVYSQTIDLDGTVYNVDTLENHQVGPSTQYTKLRLTAPTKRLDVFFLVGNVTDPNLTIRAALSRDSIYGGERPSATAQRLTTENAFYFAGTNGDFYDTGTQYNAYPVSGNMINSEIAKGPGDRHVYAFDAEEKSYIGKMTYSGNVTSGSETWTIQGLNHVRGDNALRLYNHLNGKSTRTNAFGTEVEIELINGHTWGVNRTLQAKVTKIEKNIGSMPIQKGKAVLSGHGSAADHLNTLSLGDEINITLNLTMEGNIKANFTQMTGGDNYVKIIDKGIIPTSGFWNELHPRTGLGYSQTGDSVIFCVVDGRSNSIGCNTKVLGILMKSAGAYTAFNMDGGGSSAMYISEYGKPVNTVSDGSERAVGNSIFLVATCPSDNLIAKITPYIPHIRVPQHGIYELHFRAYNQYGIQLDTDLQGVTITAPPELGTIDGNKFTCTGTDPGFLTATYNGISTQIAVTPSESSAIEILLDSVLIDHRTSYEIEVLATTATGQQPISPHVLTWTVDNPAICTIDQGILRALSNGRTFAEGRLGELKDTLYINVENPTAYRTISDTFIPNEWAINTISGWGNSYTWNTENRPPAWEHGAAINFPYAAGRSPFFRLTKDYRLYGLPDTLKVVANIGALQLGSITITLRANNSKQTVAHKLDPPFPANADFDISVPIRDLFAGSGPEIFPLYFNKIDFNIESSNTVGTSYTIAVKEIALLYNNMPTGSLAPTPVPTAFAVYPNPSKSREITIQLPSGLPQTLQAGPQTLQAELYTLSGQLLQTETLTPSGNLARFTRIALPAGLYLLKITCGPRTETVKLIVSSAK
jgi:hypothetical protein